ncbi:MULTISPECIES: hypothetical protein [unclassified Moraxella]|uniref:hypothetical protein n=1 Tax=unclassified Moraxella TaxID=2685852 RepID=UPI003AF96E48
MLIASGIIFLIWYPNPYFALFNVMTIFILMLGIDLILGPLLTFMVYKKGKKTIKMDLAVIVIIQLLAFGWGMWSIANARPAWIAIYKDTAYTISPAFITNPKNELKVTPPSIFEQNWLKPKLVFLPTDDKTENLVYQISKYLPYNPQQALKQKLSLTQVESFDKAFYQTIKTNYPTATGYFPVVTEASMDLPLILIDAQGQHVGTVVAINKITATKK